MQAGGLLLRAIDPTLLHRLRQTTIVVPPLQQRQSDIALLAEFLHHHPCRIGE